MDDLNAIIESLLFVSDEPLSIERIKTALGFAETREIRRALQALGDEYEDRGGGFALRMVAGGYQIRSRPEHKEYIKRLLRSRPPRLSRAALETLSIVAYYKPITRTDIEHIRGVDCGGVLRMLLERNLIRVLGRKEVPGRPMIYETTKRFLEVFDLKDIRDLPTINEIEALLVDASEGSAAELETAESAASQETRETPQAEIPDPSTPDDSADVGMGSRDSEKVPTDAHEAAPDTADEDRPPKAPLGD